MLEYYHISELSAPCTSGQMLKIVTEWPNLIGRSRAVMDVERMECDHQEDTVKVQTQVEWPPGI